MIFADQDGSGETRFGAWCTADTDRKKVLCLEISEIVLQTMYGGRMHPSAVSFVPMSEHACVCASPVRWWKAYSGSVKGQIRQVAAMRIPL